MRNDDALEEVFKYSKSDYEMDFRLKIDYLSFLHANKQTQEKLVFEICLLSLERLKEFLEQQEELCKLIYDVSQLGKLKGWLS